MTDADLLLPPLAAGLLALATHVPLGAQVLRRGIVFIDLAIAQLAVLGALAAGALLADDVMPAWLAAGGMALCGAAAVAAMVRRWPAHREALIGLVYVGAAAAAVLVTSADPRGAQKVAAMLSGDVLWVRPSDLWPLFGASVPFVALSIRRPRLWERPAAFYAAFATLVSLSVPLLGVYLVFATLIVPALATLRARRRRWLAGVAWGFGGYLIGLGVSLLFDLPSGPCVVVSLLAVGALAGGCHRAGAPIARPQSPADAVGPQRRDAG